MLRKSVKVVNIIPAVSYLRLSANKRVCFYRGVSAGRREELSLLDPRQRVSRWSGWCRAVSSAGRSNGNHGFHQGWAGWYALLVFSPLCGARAPVFPLVHFLLHHLLFSFFLSFIGFTCFLLLSIRSLSTRIVPLRFQAGGRRKRPNLGLVCCVFLCYLCSLVKVDSGVLFCLV